MVANHLILGPQAKKIGIQKFERGVQLNEHRSIDRRAKMLNWDDLNIFRAVASEQSFRKAAGKLKLAVNTVRARVQRLETSLDTTLFGRTRDGLILNADGTHVLEIALEMQAMSQRLMLGRGNNTVRKKGELKISCSEGIGVFWLAPRLHELQFLVPDLTVSLLSDFDQNRIHSRESDLCLGFLRPTDPDTIFCKLATLHFLPYASDAYLHIHGHPKSIEEAEKHRFVVHDAPGLHAETMSLFAGANTMRRMAITKVNTSYLLYRAVVNGLGIGALPTYVHAISPTVCALDIPVQLKFDLWLSYDRSVQKSQPVRIAIDWLKACFNPEKQPWFRERFIHPNKFQDQ
jgi:DNA-binding transcriptional LysR family regulator